MQLRTSAEFLSLMATVSLAACAHYQPKPMVPAANLDQLDARSLANPDLAQVAESAHLVATWPPDVWDLGTLTVAALYYQPDLEFARASWAIARAGIITAGQRPNANVVDIGPGYNSSTDPHTITPWILNLDLDFTFETAGKRGRRIDVAKGLSESARFQVAATAWQVRARVRQALLDLFSATQRGAVLDRQRSIQETNITLFQRQLNAGEISTFEMAQARLLLDSIRLAYVDAERQQLDARARLATAIGVPVSALDGLRLGLDGFAVVPSDIPDAAARRQALLNRADILSALADYDASQATLQLEIARQYPDIHLGPGYQMDQSSNKWTVLLFPASLPVFNRNQGPIAEAEARRTAAATAITVAQARVIGAIDRALAGFRTALDKLATADQILGQVRTVEQTAETQLAAGAISQLDLGVIQVELATRELARLEALVQLQQTVGDIEDAMQRPVDFPINPLPSNPK
jgi:cobalt-zinc-cadmium efflux system outer membrane protein